MFFPKSPVCRVSNIIEPRRSRYKLNFATEPLLDGDTSVRREFLVHEKVRVAFEANIFYITNSVDFRAPGSRT